ncbi:LIM and calponin homology domains-containing protein 1a [Cyclopterus lumpus]|uniref:LIM and calponin homology domains-containing protein 1a n=1 Tax=Cyclopterus lumpus TaxID=8103 RepID=UPI00148625CA|nr:LIM and calponin homology domains-containing protein 1a [Cyclopterus lumpus]
MASPAAGRDVPNASPRDEPGPNHPEPACLEAQKWIEAVTGKSFGDKDFRSGLENGILLCELLSAIKPGLVKKINRLPTPIAGLDNLSVFLRGCEEFGLKGSQLFDPGDLQDTSTRANLKDCNRKIKSVLNTVFWLGKAAGGCASYSGPTLNLKEFEGLLAQMKVESEEGGDSSQKRSVRDSGYDCWDSERSDSLSPPRHTRDDSLDSLDSFGSRSQHSPSPDVANRDGRGSDSEADAPSRRPDVRKDDMLARRTASSESRVSIPFNQFLPNRTNGSAYIPTPRRKPHTEEGEQRRSVSMSDILNEEEVEHLPPLSQSRYERMHEQYNNFEEDDDHWQNDLARWKNRRRSTSQELIKKEEERKRMEKRMKEEGSDSNKRKSIKTYKEIVEEKERREAELCDAYRNAATPEEAAMVLQRYALRFTISDATLDSLKLPRSTVQAYKEHKKTSPTNEASQPPHKPEPPAIKGWRHAEPEEMETNTTAQQETSVLVSSSSPTAGSLLGPVTNSENVAPPSLKLKEPRSKPTPTTPHTQPIARDAKPQTKHSEAAHVPHTTRPGHALPSPPSVSTRPVPLLAAKPYCQPRSTQSGHKPVKMDGLVRLSGEVTVDLSVSTPPTSARHSPPEVKDNPSKRMEKGVPSGQTVKDVPSEKTVKDVPSGKTVKDVPSEKTVKEVPSGKTVKDVPSGKTVKDVPSGKTVKDVPSGKTVKDVPSEKTVKDVPSEKTVKDVPSEKTQKDVPSEQTVKEVPSEKDTVKDVPSEKAAKDVPSQKTVKDVPSGKTVKDVPSEKDVPSDKTVKDVPSEKTVKDVPSEKAAKDVPSQKTVKDVPSGKTVKDVPSQKTVKDVPSEKTVTDVPSQKTQKEVPSQKTQKDVPLEQTEKDVPPDQISAYQEKVEQTPPPQTERSTSSLGSAISSLIGGRNCTITTTIVTELTHVEPHQPDIQSNGQIETPMLNLAKRVNHWVWDPNEERKRLESWQQEQERLLQEQYQREQEKLKKEWEKAQLEVKEEERKHNEEERRILEETVTPLNSTGFLNQQLGQTGTTSSAPENNQTERGNVALQQNGQSTSTGNEDQHSSKLHFLQDSACDGEPLKKQELWKTASLDRNPQLNQAHITKRSESHDVVTDKQQPSASSPQPPSPSRCVSGKRLCSGCSQPLEKGAAMIIDTLGLFFHIQCFKCGACKGQLGDATAGTDVRIRNGLLSCHECYIASRGRGQPTTL